MQAAPSFISCGMDCFGPFFIKEGRKPLKKYGAIFTCIALRAVHVEILEDLTTDAFINCLHYFMSIRGPVRSIDCDQKTNFVGVRNEWKVELEKLSECRLKDMLCRHGCDFIFNTLVFKHMDGGGNLGKADWICKTCTRRISANVYKWVEHFFLADTFFL